jgi:hypothetical protein
VPAVGDADVVEPDLGHGVSQLFGRQRSAVSRRLSADGGSGRSWQKRMPPPTRGG